jgi:hypothetical protein
MLRTKKCFIKSNRCLNVYIKVEQPTTAEREEIFIFAEIKFYVMRRVNTVGFVPDTCKRFRSLSFMSRSMRCDVTFESRIALLRKAFSLLKNRDVLYILMMMIERNNMRKTFKPMPFSGRFATGICFPLYPCFVFATKRGRGGKTTF